MLAAWGQACVDAVSVVVDHSSAMLRSALAGPPCQCCGVSQARPGWCSKSEQEPEQMHQVDTHLAQRGGFKSAFPEGSGGDQHLDQALKLAPGAADACSGLAAQPGCLAIQMLGLHKGGVSSGNPQQALAGSL